MSEAELARALQMVLDYEPFSPAWHVARDHAHAMLEKWEREREQVKTEQEDEDE